MKNYLLKTFVSIIGLFILFPVVNAAEKTVCATNCTYTTIQAAVDAAAGGDTIKVSTGSYAGFSLSASKSLTITGTGNSAPVITSTVTLSTNNKTTISGFDLRNAGALTITAGQTIVRNNLLASIIASGTANVDATLNYWGTNPNFTSLITKNDTATVTYDPYYTSATHVGSNIVSMQLTETKKTIEAGEHYNIALTVVPSSGKANNIQWSTSDEKIAVVDTNGTVTGVSEGIATITATPPWGSPYTVEITVVCEKVENPKTSIEYYIIGFGILIIGGIVLGYKNYKRAKELM